MEGAIAVIILALAVGAVGIGLGMLLARRMGHWTEPPDDEEGAQE